VENSVNDLGTAEAAFGFALKKRHVCRKEDLLLKALLQLFPSSLLLLLLLPFHLYSLSSSLSLFYLRCGRFIFVQCIGNRYEAIKEGQRFLKLSFRTLSSFALVTENWWTSGWEPSVIAMGTTIESSARITFCRAQIGDRQGVSQPRDPTTLRFALLSVTELALILSSLMSKIYYLHLQVVCRRGKVLIIQENSYLKFVFIAGYLIFCTDTFIRFRVPGVTFQLRRVVYFVQEDATEQPF
jgi:hypothetical protein